MTDLINDGPNYKFKLETYNGISIVRETNSNYVNASKMCSDNHKTWRKFKQSKYWKDTLEAFNLVIKPGLSDAGKFWTASFLAPKQVKPEFQGEYIHPKLVHFVAEYCNKVYAFQVAELMDSINDNVHEQLQQKQLPDKPENTKPIFETNIQQIVSSLRIVSDIENQQCYGIRERDKFDYLDSWTKDDVKRLFEDFKNKLHQQIGFVYNDVKIDYPQLFE